MMMMIISMPPLKGNQRKVCKNRDVLTHSSALHCHDYNQWTTVFSSSHACGRLVLAAAAFNWKSGTNSHRICKAQTLGNSLSIAVRAGCLCVHMAGGVSDRHWLKVRRVNGLILTYLLNLLTSVVKQNSCVFTFYMWPDETVVFILSCCIGKWHY